nr:MAG TPA: hypothetical protein [Caudoviricetes sp.]
MSRLYIAKNKYFCYNQFIKFWRYHNESNPQRNP